MRVRSPVVTVAQGTKSGETSRADQTTPGRKLDTTLPESFVASPAFLAASLTGFALIAFDVFGPSAHLLSSVDNGERLVAVDNMSVTRSMQYPDRGFDP